MSRWVFLLLLVASGCANLGKPAPASETELPEATLAQLEKVFGLVTDVQKEYETLLTQAKYPNDETKNSAKQWIKLKQLYYEILRVRYLECSQKRTRKALVEFVELATGFIDVPKGTFTHWELKTGTQELANLSRTESLRDDFYVMAVALVKDVK